MPDRERRSSDPLLKQLFEQNARQHEDNSGKLDEIRDTVQGLAVTRENHSGRIGTLEGWRKEVADPWITTTKDGVSQVKGVARVASVVPHGVTAALSVGTVIFGPKVWAVILAAFSHTP